MTVIVRAREWVILIVLLYSVALSFPVYGSDGPEYPGAQNLKGELGNPRALRIECRTEDQDSPSRIYCQITELYVEIASPEDLENSAEEAKRAFGELGQVESIEEFRSFCRNIREAELASAKESFERANEKSLINLLEEIARTDCEKVTQEEIKSFAARLISLGTEIERETCTVGLQERFEFFEVQGSYSGGTHYWISDNQPLGECGKLRISTLKRHPGSDSFWDYETKEIQINEDVKPPHLCEFLESPAKYTWTSKIYPVECKSIRFGWF